MTKRKPRLHDEEGSNIAVETMDVKEIKNPKVKEVACPPDCDGRPPVCDGKNDGCATGGNGINGRNGNNGGQASNGGNGSNGTTSKGNNNGDNGDFKLSTVPADPRWPNQNQTNYCFMMYVDYHRCTRKRGEDYEPCQYFKKAYKTLCPLEWIERWNSQMEEGIFPRKFDEK